MKLLVFVLNKEELLEATMEAYLEAGITGATILDSEGMGRFLAYEVPLFASFKDVMAGAVPRNKTILSMISGDEPLRRLLPILQGSIGDLSVPGLGVMFTVPIDWSSVAIADEKRAEEAER